MSEYLDWKIGDEVVCINDERCANGLMPNISSGRIYIIHSTKFNYSKFSNVETLLINVNEASGTYDASRFRKVQKHKTDISIFKSMLNKSPEENNKELVESQVKDMIDA